MDKISPYNIWIGNIYEACNYGNQFDVIINCMDQVEITKYEREEYNLLKPIIVSAHAMRYEKDKAGIIIDEYLEPKIMNWLVDFIESENPFEGTTKILVHCAAGQERSPLTVIYWLYQYSNMSIEEAYEYVKERHPGTLNRLSWLKKML